MEIRFATLANGGYGTHVIIEVELLDANTTAEYEEFVPGIGLSFCSSVGEIFMRGDVYIRKAITDNYDVIKDKIAGDKILLIRKATADLVDYQPIAFLGATIKWMNECFGTAIQIPKYTYDRETRTFAIER